MLEQIAYESKRVSEQRQRVYQVGDLEQLSATELYTGHLPKFGPGGFGLPKFTPKPLPDLPMFPTKPIGSVSDFKLASSFGLGPGIAKESFNFLERYRAGKHEKYGEDHLNLEIYSPIDILGKKKRIDPLLNLHIDIDIKE